MCRNLNSDPSFFFTLTTSEASKPNFSGSALIFCWPLQEEVSPPVFLKYCSKHILALLGGLAVGTSWFVESDLTLESPGVCPDVAADEEAPPVSWTTRSPLSPRMRSHAEASKTLSFNLISCCSLFSPQWGQMGSPDRSVLKHFRWNQCFHLASLRHW